MTIQTDSYEEFINMVKNRDIKIASPIVNTILKNLNGRRRFIPALKIQISSNNSYDVTVDRNEFIPILEKNLKIFEEHEMFEECFVIKDTINKLKEKQK
jgi:protein-arginine kinase activator protein McsA